MASGEFKSLAQRHRLEESRRVDHFVVEFTATGFAHVGELSTRSSAGADEFGPFGPE